MSKLVMLLIVPEKLLREGAHTTQGPDSGNHFQQLTGRQQLCCTIRQPVPLRVPQKVPHQAGGEVALEL